MTYPSTHHMVQSSTHRVGFEGGTRRDPFEVGGEGPGRRGVLGCARGLPGSVAQVGLENSVTAKEIHASFAGTSCMCRDCCI